MEQTTITDTTTKRGRPRTSNDTRESGLPGLEPALRLRGWSISRAAKEIGEYPSALYEYARGNKIPTATVIVRISRKLGISADILLGLVSAHSRSSHASDAEQVLSALGSSPMRQRDLHRVLGRGWDVQRLKRALGELEGRGTVRVEQLACNAATISLVDLDQTPVRSSHEQCTL